MISLLTLIITIVIVGLILWLVETYIPMDAMIKRILEIVVIIIVIVWLLQAFGLLGAVGSVGIR